MDFFETVGVLFRRWRVTVPTFILGVVITARIMAGVAAEYESFGTVLILPATVAVVELADREIYDDERNPFFHAGVTRTLSRSLPIVVGSSATRDTAETAGLSPNYEIELDHLQPILFITAKGTTPRQSSNTLDFVLAELYSELNERQGLTENIPSDQRAALQILSEVHAVEDRSGSTKVLGTMAIVVVLATVIVGFLAEGIAERRRMRRISPQ